MSEVKREHLAGLQYALMVAEENWPNEALTEILSDLIAQASAAPEQEPFIYVHELIDNGGGIWLGCPSESDVRNSYIEGETGREVIALYRHPSAEIERLRAENTLLDKEDCGVRLALKAANEGWDAALDQRDELQQKLAEAQALLLEWGEMFHGAGISSGPLTNLRQKNAAFLSATAQPAEGVNSNE